MIRTGSCKRSVPPPEMAVMVSVVRSSEDEEEKKKRNLKLRRLRNPLMQRTYPGKPHLNKEKWNRRC